MLFTFLLVFISVSWEAIISKAPPVAYLAYTAGCSAINTRKERKESITAIPINSTYGADASVVVQ